MSDYADSRSDADLLAAARDDRDAFAIFYRRHVRDVLALSRRLAPPGEAGDVVAEVFATALVHRRRYDPRRGTAGAWLTGILLHKLADARRRGALDARLCRRLRITPPPLDHEPAVEVEGLDLLDELPAEQRAAVLARVVDERPYPDIARELAVSEPAARKRVSRALAALRAQFEEDRP